MALKGLKISLRETIITSSFHDVTETWQIPFVEKAKELSIVSGQSINGKLTFRPNDTITRAEIAKIVVKTMEIH